MNKLMNFIKNNLVPSSLKILTFYELRQKNDIFLKFKDKELSEVFEKLGFTVFGTSGVYAKFK